MSLPHALLGLINYKPLTGYDLKSTFSNSINMFWNASLPQIYRTLHKMEKNGWVLSNIEQQKDKPNKKIYKITDMGKKELRTWLTKPFEFSQIKSRMMIKVFFGNQTDDGAIVNQIREWRKQEKKHLEKYESELKQTADRFAVKFEVEDDKRFWMLTVDFGIQRSKMIVKWCDSALEISRIIIMEMKMKKILILNGNPDLKNSRFENDLDKLKEILKESGMNVHDIKLRDMKLNHCIGCYNCWLKTPGICIFNDDGPKILKKYIKSDAVIFASPIISGLFSALLQSIYERLLPLVHPYFQIVKGACQHINRYKKYPVTCLVLGKNVNYGTEFTEIINSVCRSKKTRAHLFTKVLENNIKEIADEINCI